MPSDSMIAYRERMASSVSYCTVCFQVRGLLSKHSFSSKCVPKCNLGTRVEGIWERWNLLNSGRDFDESPTAHG